MTVPTTSDAQLLARVLVQTREGGQIGSEDAQALGNLAQFGDQMGSELPGNEGNQPTTMPEERRGPNRMPSGGFVQ